MMFCPEGYVPFHEIAAEVTEFVDRGEIQDDLYFGYDQTTRWQNFWLSVIGTYAGECPSLSLASPEGQVFRIAPNILASADEPQSRPSYFGLFFVDSQTGLVTTANFMARVAAAEALWADMLKDPNREKRLEQAFNPFVVPETKLTEDEQQLLHVIDHRRFIAIFSKFEGWALTSREQHSPKRLGLFDKIGKLKEPSSVSADYADPRLMVSDIVRMFDEGVPITKALIRSTLGKDMKQEVFLAAWKQAAVLRPQLKKPGPKGSARSA